MKWSSKVPEVTREKVQGLIERFDEFIMSTHGRGALKTEQDEKIMKDWLEFRQLIEDNPNDFEPHYDFLSRLKQINKNPESKLKLCKSSSNLQTSSRFLPDKKKGSVLDKQHLRLSLTQFMSVVKRNNRDILKI